MSTILGFASVRLNQLVLVKQDILERREFLQEMTDLKRGHLYQAQMEAEISQVNDFGSMNGAYIDQN